MHISRLLMLLAAGGLAAVSISLHAQAQSANTDVSSRARLRPPASADFNAFRESLAPGPFGLKPQPGGSREGIALPFSLNYNREIRSIIMPLDEKNTWDVGVMFNVNTAPGLEPATSPALGLQPKRTPGIMLQKRF